MYGSEEVTSASKTISYKWHNIFISNLFFSQFTKQYNNLFAEAGVPPKRKLTRFLVTPEAAIEAGL